MFRRLALYLFPLLCWTSYGAVRADLMIHWDGVSRGALNSSNLTASVYGWMGNNGIVGDTKGRYTVEERTNSLTFPVSVTISNQTWTGSGTNIVSNNTGAGGDDGLIRFSIPLHTNLAVCGWLHLGAVATGSDSLDLITFQGWDGSGWNTFNLENNTTVGFRSHSQTNGAASTFGGKITGLDTNRWYWFVWTRLASENWCKLAIYDPQNNYAQFGATSESGTIQDKQVFLMDFQSGYLGDPEGTVRFGPMYLTYDPTVAERAAMTPSVVCSDLELATVQAAVDAAVDGQTVILPDGAVVWTNSLTITNAITLAGTNAAWITNFAVLNTTPLIRSGPAVRVTGVNLVGTNQHGYGLQTTANAAGWCGTRIDHSFFQGFNTAIFYEGFGLVDHCGFLDNWVSGRNYGDIAEGESYNWSNYYPIPYNSTNYTVWEDNNFTNNANAAFLHLESSEGAAYVARFNHFWTTLTDANMQIFDAHKSTLSVQWYSNVCHYANGANSVPWADLRGGEALIYSNTVVGVPGWNKPVVQYRLEYDDLPEQAVTNAYIWNNTANTGGIGIYAAGGDRTTTNIIVGVDIFTSAPGTLRSPPYPHPLISGVAAEPETPETPETPVTPAANTRTHTISGTINIGTLRRAQ